MVMNKLVIVTVCSFALLIGGGGRGCGARPQAGVAVAGGAGCGADRRSARKGGGEEGRDGGVERY